MRALAARSRAREQPDGKVRAEIVAIGTELLLGQIVDTNSAWLAQELASTGIDCEFQTRVGDNVARIADVLRVALERADAVICGGGLGPTQDDVTREAIATVMGVEIVDDREALALVELAFAARNRPMSPSNRRQGQVPKGARIIPQRLGTAPGLICEVGSKVIYALPGVPDELREMTRRVVLTDLAARSSERAVIASRILRTWGLGESRVGEIVAPRLAALDAAGPGAATIAFLARGMEGVQVRVTVKAASADAARAVLDDEERELRALLEPDVFGVDDETMEARIASLLVESGRTLAVAESFTGGLIAARLVAVPGASRWFRGGIVAYASELKRSLLAVDEGPVVTEAAAAQMAAGARSRLGADVALSTTGVAGPDRDEDLVPGTAFVGLAFADGESSAVAMSLFGDRQQIRDRGSISALDALRRRLERGA